MEVKNIKEENNKKIEKYEIILEKTDNELSELKLKNHNLKVKYNKNNKETKKYKKIVNIGCTSVIVILTVPVFLKSLIAGLSVSGIYSGWLVISNKALNKMNKQDNENDNCTETEQTLVSNEIKELEKFKYTIENSIFVRNIINAIIDKQYIAQTELETVSNVFNDDDILLDFDIDEYNVLNEYIKDYDLDEENINNSLNIQYSNDTEKVYQKTK